MSSCVISLSDFMNFVDTSIVFWLIFGISFSVVLVLTIPMLNISEIISRYLSASNNKSKAKWIIIVFCQLIIASIVSIKFTFTSQNISTLLTLASIFAGLMFNLLLLSFDLLHKVKNKESEKAHTITEYENNVKETISETHGLIVS